MRKNLLLVSIIVILLCVGLCACKNQNTDVEDTIPSKETIEIINAGEDTEPNQTETEAEDETTQIDTTETVATIPIASDPSEADPPAIDPPVAEPPVTEPPATEVPPEVPDDGLGWG